MNRLEEKFKDLKASKQKAFIPYIMAGDGGIDVLGERLSMLERFGASAIEVGIPFSDPVADGPVIQQAGIRALKRGTTLKDIIGKIGEVRDSISIPILIMSYLNPIYAYGIGNFVRDSRAAGIDGCIIPDLPFEEEAIIGPELSKAGIELIRLVTLTTPLERIKKISSTGKGFVYAVTVKGITGGRGRFHDNLATFLDEVREASPIPVLAGFGISDGDQARELAAHCDGVIAGSKIVELFEHGKIEEVGKLVSCFKNEIVSPA